MTASPISAVSAASAAAAAAAAAADRSIGTSPGRGSAAAASATAPTHPSAASASPSATSVTDPICQSCKRPITLKKRNSVRYYCYYCKQPIHLANDCMKIHYGKVMHVTCIECYQKLQKGIPLPPPPAPAMAQTLTHDPRVLPPYYPPIMSQQTGTHADAEICWSCNGPMTIKKTQCQFCLKKIHKAADCMKIHSIRDVHYALCTICYKSVKERCRITLQPPPAPGGGGGGGSIDGAEATAGASSDRGSAADAAAADAGASAAPPPKHRSATSAKSVERLPRSSDPICPSCNKAILPVRQDQPMHCFFCKKRIHSNAYCYRTTIRTDQFGISHNYFYCRSEECSRNSSTHPHFPICWSCDTPITEIIRGVERCHICNHQIHIATSCMKIHYDRRGEPHNICRVCYQTSQVSPGILLQPPPGPGVGGGDGGGGGDGDGGGGGDGDGGGARGGGGGVGGGGSGGGGSNYI